MCESNNKTSKETNCHHVIHNLDPSSAAAAKFLLIFFQPSTSLTVTKLNVTQREDPEIYGIKLQIG